VEIIDYIFIGCIIIAIFCFLVVLLKKIIKIPEEMMMKSSQSSIKKGETIGAIIGIVIGLFICYYITINNYFGLYDIFFG
tara:strand:- start:284 stop:523 length:240 start_codon:yes stop_codon:yes gene_type:complete